MTDLATGAASAPPTERTVLIIDDHRSFAEALAIAIDAQIGLSCVAIAGSGAEGVAAVTRCRPDVVVVDMRLPDTSGPALIVKLQAASPGLPVLALTAYADAANVAAAAQAGVCAFLRKECSVQDIVASLRSAGDLPLTIDAATLGSMMSRSRPPVPQPLEAGGVRLTPREREVLGLLAEANDAQGIARHLGISIHTIRGYVKALLAKLEAHSQLEAVVRAKQLGILTDVPTTMSMDLHPGPGSHVAA
jgi:DNA-binding NarL/FixJ family response regulator